MWGHSDAVYDMVALSDSALCSCGADGLVILWKDGREQTEIRYEDTFPSSTHTRVCQLISRSLFPHLALMCCTQKSDGGDFVDAEPAPRAAHGRAGRDIGARPLGSHCPQRNAPGSAQPSQQHAATPKTFSDIGFFPIPPFSPDFSL